MINVFFKSGRLLICEKLIVNYKEDYGIPEDSCIEDVLGDGIKGHIASFTRNGLEECFCIEDVLRIEVNDD